SEEEDEESKPPPTKRAKPTESSGSSESESGSSSEESSSSSEEDEEDVAAKAKAKAAAEKTRREAASVAAANWTPKATNKAVGGGSSGKGHGESFKRVRDEDWVGKLVSGTDNNEYENTFGEGGYGYKAHQKLITVRGKDFRHEKTKKKRGSYRGGQISLGSNSFKFDSD
ncbi:unnamed protein product, partial [Chrysoparadoxa australica]